MVQDLPDEYDGYQAPDMDATGIDTSKVEPINN